IRGRGAVDVLLLEAYAPERDPDGRVVRREPGRLVELPLRLLEHSLLAVGAPEVLMVHGASRIEAHRLDELVDRLRVVAGAKEKDSVVVVRGRRAGIDLDRAAERDARGAGVAELRHRTAHAARRGDVLRVEVERAAVEARRGVPFLLPLRERG